MQFESNNKGPAMNCKKFIQLPTYCFDQAICNLLWLQNHELKSQKEKPENKNQYEITCFDFFVNGPIL